MSADQNIIDEVIRETFDTAIGYELQEIINMKALGFNKQLKGYIGVNKNPWELTYDDVFDVIPSAKGEVSISVYLNSPEDNVVHILKISPGIKSLYQPILTTTVRFCLQESKAPNKIKKTSKDI